MSVFALEFGPGKIPWIYTVVNGQQRLMISAIIRIINFVFFSCPCRFSHFGFDKRSRICCERPCLLTDAGRGGVWEILTQIRPNSISMIVECSAVMIS